jgi:vancomycin resistance protein YoaR
MIHEPETATSVIDGKRASVDLRQESAREWVSPGALQIGSVPLANVGLAVGAFVGLLLILLIGGGIIFEMSYANRMYPGVRALGISLGGMTREEARTALSDRVTALSGRSITIGFKELSWTVVGQHLGVRPEVDPVVDEAFRLGHDGSSLARLALQLRLMVNGSAYEVQAPAFDPAAMQAFMQALAGAVDRPVVDGSLSIKPDGTVAYGDGMAGRKLQIDATRTRLEAALGRSDTSTVELVVEETPPNVSAQDLATTKAQAEAMLSAPLVLKFEESRWQLNPPQLAAMATAQGTQGIQIDRAQVKVWVAKLAGDVEQDPQNARFSWEGGTLSVLRPSKDGRHLDVDKTVDLVLAQALTTNRTVDLPVSVTKPDVSATDADKLQIQGPIEVARTSFAGASPPKRANIGLATERLNGVVVPPGKMFSFNKEVGSTSLDAGYKLGWGIANSGANVKTVPSVAGGICQVATTLFHTLFWGGYQIEERNYHLYWIPSYTSRNVEGLDATVDEEAGLDLKFVNTTDNYVLIQSWIEDGNKVVFGLYGTKPDWTVKVTPGDRQDVQKAKQEQVIEDEPTLPAGQRLAVEGAMDGFKITNLRTVTKPGEPPRTLQIQSVYRPATNTILVGTGGKPAGPSTVIPNRPTSGGGADTSPRTTTPAPATTPAARPTAVPATGAPAAKPSNSQPTPAPKPSSNQPAPAAKPIISPLFPGNTTTTRPTG